MINDLKTQFTAARLAGVPLLAVRTADVAATIAFLRPVIAALKEKGENPIVQWDAARGITHLNRSGLDSMAKGKILPDDTVGFVEAMLAAQKLDDATILFVVNGHRQLVSQEPGATAQQMQAVANLRDQYKRNFRMAVFVGPAFQAPPELQHDIMILDHALPSRAELKEIVVGLLDGAKLPVAADVDKDVDALVGLSSFSAEQNAAVALTEKGIDRPTLWERKYVTIGETPGLKIWTGKERFSDIVGQEALKKKLRRRIEAKTPVGVGVWIDEIDKALANVEHDTSGVRMYQMLKLLTEMEDNGWGGFVGVGVAGGGKSLIAKAFGNEAGVPMIALDLGATESKYVGESEANLNRAIEIIKAVGDGNAFFIATSNAASVMRPELQRRFTTGFWMFDLMNAEERAAAWAFYIKRYGLKAQAIPDDAVWTGAEIRNCCRTAWDEGVSLVEAAETIVPMAQSRPEEVERLRQAAHGKFLDANKGGTYRYDETPMLETVRKVMLARARTEGVQ